MALLLGAVSACTPMPTPAGSSAAFPPLRGQAPALGWHTLGAAQNLGGGTVSLLQPGTGLAMAAGVSNADGSFVLYVPPTVRPVKDSTFFLDVLRRRQGRLQGLRTIVQWDGSHWLSCSNGSSAVDASLDVTTATTAAALICQQTGLSPGLAIGRVQGSQISLPDSIAAAWLGALQQALTVDLSAGRDPLRHPAAVITARTPGQARAGESLTLTGFGFGASGQAQLGEQPLDVRQWQDTQVVVQVPAGGVSGSLRLSLADGKQLTTEPLLLDGGWTAMPSLAVPRGGESVAVGAVGTTVLVAGGVDGQYAPIPTLERLQETAGTRGAAMTQARSGATGAVLDGKFYVVGGMGASGPSDAVEAYDPSQNAWQSMASLPVSVTQAAVAATGTQVIVLGGDLGSGLSERIYRWTLGQTAWQTASAVLDPPRAGATAVALSDGSVVIAGGRDAQGRALNRVERYDPGADALVVLPSLQVARYAHAMAAVGNRVVVAGGWQDATGALASLETWQLDQAAWQLGPSLPAPRYGLAAATVGDAVWFVGGANDSEGTGGEVWRWRF